MKRILLQGLLASCLCLPVIGQSSEIEEESSEAACFERQRYKQLEELAKKAKESGDDAALRAACTGPARCQKQGGQYWRESGNCLCPACNTKK